MGIKFPKPKNLNKKKKKKKKFINTIGIIYYGIYIIKFCLNIEYLELKIHLIYLGGWRRLPVADYEVMDPSTRNKNNAINEWSWNKT